MVFKIGDYVKKNPTTWVSNDFDGWSRGVGIGQVVEPPYTMSPDQVDVMWPGGRCFENVGQLLPVKDPEVDSGGDNT